MKRMKFCLSPFIHVVLCFCFCLAQMKWKEGAEFFKVLVSGILIKLFFWRGWGRLEHSLMEPFKAGKNTWKYVERLAVDI